VADTLDQAQMRFDSTIMVAGPQGLIGGASAAQTFTAGTTGLLDRVQLLIDNQGTAGDPLLMLELTTTSATTPSATVLARAALPAARVMPALTWVQADFASPALLFAGVRYAIVAHTTGGAVYNWTLMNGDAYTGGAHFFGGSPAGTWSRTRSDLTLRTYVESAAPAEVIPRALSMNRPVASTILGLPTLGIPPLSWDPLTIAGPA
jgi:hypothetical protein